MANEVWQVQVQGVVYQTDSETLKQWATQGNLLPEDLVKKGNLNWMPAGHVPLLRPIFGAAGLSLSQGGPTYASSQGGAAYAPSPSAPLPPSPAPVSQTGSSAGAPVYGAIQPTAGPSNVCRNHPQVTPDYICYACMTSLCKNCVNMVANRMPICTVCGELCRPYAELAQQMARMAFQTSAFNFNDLFDGLRFPFTDLVAFILFCVLYTVLKFGANFGGLIGGLMFTVVSTGLLFAMMSTVIRRVADGRVTEGFTPAFDSIYDDVIHPVFLSFGVYLISFGPFTVAMVYAFAGIIRAGMGRLYEDSAATSSAQTQAGVAIGAAIISGIWGLLYYPMALLVAGFTQSFVAVVNPMVGVDTIKRMGSTYGLVFVMYLLLAFSTGLINVVVKAVTPGIVTLAILSPLEVYFSLVLSYVLGISLFKCSDKLGLD